MADSVVAKSVERPKLKLPPLDCTDDEKLCKRSPTDHSIIDLPLPDIRLLRNTINEFFEKSPSSIPTLSVEVCHSDSSSEVRCSELATDQIEQYSNRLLNSKHLESLRATSPLLLTLIFLATFSRVLPRQQVSERIDRFALWDNTFCTGNLLYRIAEARRQKPGTDRK